MKTMGILFYAARGATVPGVEEILPVGPFTPSTARMEAWNSQFCSINSGKSRPLKFLRNVVVCKPLINGLIDHHEVVFNHKFQGRRPDGPGLVESTT